MKTKGPWRTPVSGYIAHYRAHHPTESCGGRFAPGPDGYGVCEQCGARHFVQTATNMGGSVRIKPRGLTAAQCRRYLAARSIPFDRVDNVQSHERESDRLADLRALVRDRMRSEDPARVARLAPGGVPRWVRCYDNGGRDAPDGEGSLDRYTVVFTGRAAPDRAPGIATQYPYLAMNAAPFHPQGIGQHGHTDNQPADTLGRKGAWGGVAIGRRCHLGVRIRFEDLPPDCQRCVWSDYAAIWGIPMPRRFTRKARG